ncbi:MAG: DUF1573 domain-containing protein [Bacteroidota bacterium]
MKGRIAFLTVLFLSFGLMAFAQKIQFDKTTHEFGEMDKGAKAEHTFSFTNMSEEPIKLTRVRASCGCTTPKWTTNEIKPGEKGEIDVKYNTNRMGAFTKTVTVTYDSVERPIILYIKGKVNASPEDENAKFPIKMGSLAFDKDVHALGVLDSDKEKTVKIRVKNIGPKPVTFTGDMDKEIMFDVKVADQTLTPGQVSTIDVTTQGNKFITYSAFSKKVVLYTDDENQKDKAFTFNGSVNRVYTAEEKAKMPKIEFETLEYNAGNVLEGEKVTYAFVFKNTGKEDLVLDNVKASCGCTATAPKDKIVKAGQTSEIVATFNSRGRRGMQNKSITVRSNDPDKPAVILRLKVNVEQDPFHQNNLGPATGSN